MNAVLYNKIFNMIIDNKGIEADKYALEDAFMSIIEDIHDGFDPADAFIEAFDLVFDTHLTKAYVNSRIALCKGFKGV